jgi:sialidase-1
MRHLKLVRIGYSLLLAGLLLASVVTADEPDAINLHKTLKPVRLFQGEGSRNYRIPTITVTNRGTLLAFIAERMGRGDFGHDTNTVMRRSTDGGATWTEPETILSEKGIDFHSGPVVVDRQTGSIFKFARSHGAKTKPGTDWRDNYILRSDDDGQSWTQSVLELENPRASFRFGPGNGGQGAQLADGTLVIQGGYYRVVDGNQTMSLCLIESRDHGQTWRITKGSDLDKAHVEFCIAETAPGRIYINMREKYTPTRLYTNIHTGKTPIDVARPINGLPAAECRGGMAKVQHEQKAFLYFTGPTGEGKTHKDRRVNLSLFRSNLDGSDWQKVAQIYQGVSGYSALTVLPNGDLACLFESGEEILGSEDFFVRIPKELFLPEK